MNKEFNFKSKSGNNLSISTYGIENLNTSPCLIFVHGFKGFKDWGFFPYLGKYFSNEGYFVITFNFSHNGIGKNSNEFSEMDKFAKNTISLEISELSEIINAYYDGYFGTRGLNQIILIGHSRGGAVSILSSLINDKPTIYVLWSSVAILDRYTKRQKEIWRENGFFEVLNSRTNQIMRLNVDLLEDIEKNQHDSLNIQKAISDLGKPLLIIHGEQDLTVPFSEAEQLYKWSDKRLTKLVKIPNAGHTFDIVHPFEGSNFKLDKVIQSTKEFIEANIN